MIIESIPLDVARRRQVLFDLKEAVTLSVEEYEEIQPWVSNWCKLRRSDMDTMHLSFEFLFFFLVYFLYMFLFWSLVDDVYSRTQYDYHFSNTANIIQNQSAMQKQEHTHHASTHNEHTTAASSTKKKHPHQPAKAYAHAQHANPSQTPVPSP
jgi:ABC-type nickel/cobalt efflux system permease component RcnA